MEMIIYDSRANSGTTKHFAKQLGRLFNVPAISVADVTPYTPIHDYVLCTYTIDYGEVPQATQRFLEAHASKMVGVVANGSSNFRAMGLFARAGDRISAKYDTELIGRLDMGGSKQDLIAIAERIHVLTGKSYTQNQVDQVVPRSIYQNGYFCLKPL